MRAVANTTAASCLSWFLSVPAVSLSSKVLSISTDDCCLLIILGVQLCVQHVIVDRARGSVARSIGVTKQIDIRVVSTSREMVGATVTFC